MFSAHDRTHWRKIGIAATGAELWGRVDNLLQAALERPPSECAEFFRQACMGDEALEREVRSLLTSQQQAGSFLERPAIEVAARALARQQSNDAQESADSLSGEISPPESPWPGVRWKWRWNRRALVAVVLAAATAAGVGYLQVLKRPNRTGQCSRRNYRGSSFHRLLNRIKAPSRLKSEG